MEHVSKNCLYVFEVLLPSYSQRFSLMHEKEDVFQTKAFIAAKLW